MIDQLHDSKSWKSRNSAHFIVTVEAVSLQSPAVCMLGSYFVFCWTQAHFCTSQWRMLLASRLNEFSFFIVYCLLLYFQLNKQLFLFSERPHSLPEPRVLLSKSLTLFMVIIWDGLFIVSIFGLNPTRKISFSASPKPGSFFASKHILGVHINLVLK